MLLLFESPAGFALFKVLDEENLSNIEDLGKEFLCSHSAQQIVKLIAFDKFDNTPQAIEAVAKLAEGDPSEGLLKFLKANCEGEVLAVADSKLGNVIKEKLRINCVHNDVIMELSRGVRSQFTELMSDLGDQDLTPTSFGLSHSLARNKLEFSSDEVDETIIQTIGLLDELDKELNYYSKEIREWYGYHFPELDEIIQDNVLYAKSVNLMGNKINASKLDFSEILAYEVETELKEAAAISMGKELSDFDLITIRELCDQVLSIADEKTPLENQIKSSMNTFAPNLTALVGELVGARLISHSGSLFNLSKLPGSSIQMLGAEKAFFRAFRTKHATTKCGLIQQAPLVVQASPKHKGAIARSLAAKAAIAIRCDVFGEGQDNTMGLESFAKLEARLRNLEGQGLHRRQKPKFEVYDDKVEKMESGGGLITSAKLKIVLFVCFLLVLILCWKKFFCI